MTSPLKPLQDHIMPTYGRTPVCFVSGEGASLIDDQGKTYLDMVSGVAVNSLGHNSEVIKNALATQAAKVMHISNLYWNEPQLKLAEKLIALSEGQMKHVFFCNSGTESLEGAVKIAKKFGKARGKQKLVYMENAFHGRSMGALAITGQPKYQQPFGPMLSGCVTTPLNDLEAFKQLTEEIGDDIAAIFIEPIQGEGGVLPADLSFLEALKAFCEIHDALLIFDEVQCGAGRLGTYFAYQSFGVVPDLVCMAKGLGGGVPIGAFLANERASVLSPGDHGSTYGGNPLMCAVALAVTETVSEPAFLEQVKRQGALLKSLLAPLKDEGLILDHRGEGLLQCIAVKSAAPVVQAAFEAGLLLIGAGGDTVRILPPLNVGTDTLEQFVTALKAVLETIASEVTA